MMGTAWETREGDVIFMPDARYEVITKIMEDEDALNIKAKRIEDDYFDIGEFVLPKSQILGIKIFRKNTSMNGNVLE